MPPIMYLHFTTEACPCFIKPGLNYTWFLKDWKCQLSYRKWVIPHLSHFSRQASWRFVKSLEGPACYKPFLIIRFLHKMDYTITSSYSLKMAVLLKKPTVSRLALLQLFGVSIQHSTNLKCCKALCYGIVLYLTSSKIQLKGFTSSLEDS